MTSNTNLNNMKIFLSKYYKNYIQDNKFIFNFLDDITDTKNNSNRFAFIVKKIFLFEIYKKDTSFLINQNEINNNDDIDNIDKISYTSDGAYIYNIIDTLLNILLVLIVLLISDDFNEEVYSKISILNIEYTLNEKELTRNYELKNNILTLYIKKIANKKNISVNKYDDNFIVSKYDLTHDEVIKNFLLYFISMKNYNMKSQILAIFGFIILLIYSFVFYITSEIILYNTKKNNIACINYTTIINEFQKIKLSIELLNNLENMTDNYINIKDCIIKYETPYIIVELPEISIDENILKNFFIINNKKTALENYAIIIDNKTYQIQSIDYFINTNYVKKLILYNINPNELLINTNNTTIIVKRKDLVDFKQDFVIATKELGTFNRNIEINKDNINKSYLIYEKNKTKLNLLTLQLNIYYILLTILFIILIGITIIDLEYHRKLIYSIFIIIIIIIMLFVNYFIKIDYIEEYNNYKEHFITTASPNCDNLKSIAEKIQFIQNNIQLFTDTILDVGKTWNNYLPTVDFYDLYKKLSSSLKNERKTYKGYNKLYFYKDKIAKNKINLIKDEIINISSFINMITISFFIIITTYIIYISLSYYNNYIFIITFIALIINIWIYYIYIIKPVRTSVKNNYWIKPITKSLH